MRPLTPEELKKISDLIMLIYDHPIFGGISILLTVASMISGAIAIYLFLKRRLLSTIARFRSRRYHIPFRHYPKFDSLTEINLWFEFLDNPDKNFYDIRAVKLGLTGSSQEDIDKFYKSLSAKERVGLRSLANKDAIYDSGVWGSPYSNSRALLLNSKFTYVDFHLAGKCKSCKTQIDVGLKQFQVATGATISAIFPRKQPMAITKLQIGSLVHSCSTPINLHIKGIVFGQLQ